MKKNGILFIIIISVLCTAIQSSYARKFNIGIYGGTLLPFAQLNTRPSTIKTDICAISRLKPSLGIIGTYQFNNNWNISTSFGIADEATSIYYQIYRDFQQAPINFFYEENRKLYNLRIPIMLGYTLPFKNQKTRNTISLGISKSFVLKESIKHIAKNSHSYEILSRLDLGQIGYKSDYGVNVEWKTDFKTKDNNSIFVALNFYHGLNNIYTPDYQYNIQKVYNRNVSLRIGFNLF